MTHISLAWHSHPTDADKLERAAAWLLAEIEARSVRSIAREHGLPMAETRRLIAEQEARLA